MGTIRAQLAHVGISVRDGADAQGANPANHYQVLPVSGWPDTAGFNPIRQLPLMVGSLAILRESHRVALGQGSTEMRVICHRNAWSCYFNGQSRSVIALVSPETGIEQEYV